MFHDYEMCRALWRKYSGAMSIHVQLENKLRLTALQDDAELVESLTRETEGAEQIRCDLRQSIREHEPSRRLSNAAAQH